MLHPHHPTGPSGWFGGTGPSHTLPDDVMAASVRRLRALAVLYAVVFFLADFFPFLVDPSLRSLLFTEAQHWIPGVISIAVACFVVALTFVRGLPNRLILNLGLGFEVVGSFGIATAEYHAVLGPITYPAGHTGLGLSWVTAWVMLFTMVVPARPWKSFIVALASLSSSPIVLSLYMRNGVIPFQIEGVAFFFNVVFPPLLILLMAHVGARIIYRLGTDVSKARELGSYRLVERLGVGGMGEVWRAEHRLLARPAAIKIVRPELAGAHDPATAAVLLSRFEREAQATAAMRSPHTLELYDYGVSQGGTFYYVAELLDGLDFETLVERWGPVPPERVIHLLTQACHSLGEAHECGLIHRDVKPANIFTCRYGRELDYVKVLDFGLVTMGSNGAGDAVKLTADLTVSGTPAFMSPEQVMGDRAVDGRTDLYALGCVGYWLLTGHPVFRAETALQTMMQHARKEPIPPSQRASHAVPRELEGVIMACLAKNPDDRPPTADALRERLSHSARGLPVWDEERARAWWAAHHPAERKSGGS